MVQGGGGGHGDGAAQEQSPGTCDLYKGRWVYDESRAPVYKESDCSFLTEQVTCTRNGRRDDDYQKWRWQPDGCDLPRYHHGLDSLLACHCISSVYPFFPFLQIQCAYVYVYVHTGLRGPARVVG